MWNMDRRITIECLFTKVHDSRQYTIQTCDSAGKWRFIFEPDIEKFYHTVDQAMSICDTIKDRRRIVLIARYLTDSCEINIHSIIKVYDEVD